ncbi:hypothetical protein [uncultured Winogradskyella sp.]|uniref:hypothetical protein n=1 Tax=uncultured Winogradskyella sp. TaxID=395353 RepID=UPI0030DC9F7A|tara:strand:- start:16903 stop:17562 length:660 start_codon:yes stop_codon:yes gene_type:complete
MVGYVQIQRDILDWEWYQSPNVSRLWFHLIIKANFKDKKWQGQAVKRGQLITSNNNLAAELSLSIQNIRTALSKLKKTGYITIKTTSQFTLITLINYDKSQSVKGKVNKQNNIQSTYKEQSNGKQSTTTKESNNQKKVNKDKIEVRLQKFKKQVFAHSQYDIEILNSFFNYWSETDRDKKLMKHESQDFFEIDKRLVKWKKNEKPKYSKIITSGTSSNR